MGTNMFKSMRYWLTACDLGRPDKVEKGKTQSFKLTNAAKLIQQYDPYLEDYGTLWVVHSQLASNRDMARFWYTVFNELPNREFNENRLVNGQEDLLQREGELRVTESSIRKDANCFMRTYLPSILRRKGGSVDDGLDCPLSTLGLAREAGFPGMYKFRVGDHKNLPTDVFAYVLFRFKERMRPEDITVSLEDIRWKPLSPGRLLCLDNRAILLRLEELEAAKGWVRLNRAAGLNMVTFEDIKSSEVLESYYKDDRLNY